MSVTVTVTDPDKTMELAEQIERVVEFTHRPTGIITEVTGSPVLGYQITPNNSEGDRNDDDGFDNCDDRSAHRNFQWSC